VESARVGTTTLAVTFLAIDSETSGMPTIQEEVDKNYEEFLKLLPSIIRDHRGEYALMKDGKIITFFLTSVDARAAADSFITDGLFSIQQVTDLPIDLGYFNYAIHVDKL
jgi:hypothetical protein